MKASSAAGPAASKRPPRSLAARHPDATDPHRGAVRPRRPRWPWWRTAALAITVTVLAAVTGALVVLHRAASSTTEWVPSEQGVIRER